LYSYPASSLCDFSLNIGLKVSSNAAASLLSFVIAALAIVPNINIANGLDSNAQPANNSNNLAGSHNIGKQTSGSDEKDDSKDGETVTPSQQSSPDDSILLHFPNPADHHGGDIKTTTDQGNNQKANGNDNDNDNGNPHRNSDNDNKNSKGKDTTTNTTPLHLPFP
jgi:hypothetical protein